MPEGPKPRRRGPKDSWLLVENISCYMSCFGTDDISWSARSGLVGKVGFPRSASPNPWPTNLLQRSDCCSSGKEESGKDACVMWTNANMELWSWNALNIYSSTGLRKSIGKALLCTWAADAAAAAGSVQQQQQQCSRPGGERAVAGSCSLPTPPASALTAWEDFQVLWPSSKYSGPPVEVLRIRWWLGARKLKLHIGSYSLSSSWCHWWW